MIQLAWRFLSPCGTNPQAGPFDRRYNKIGGNLLVDANRATTDVSGNSIGGNMECENNNTLTYLDLNSVTGQHQGQCAAFQ